MNENSAETLSVVVEREMPHPPEKIWRALTQPHLIEEWLMKNDFKPVVDHRFNLRADWGAVDCQVMAVEPTRFILPLSADAYAMQLCKQGLALNCAGRLQSIRANTCSRAEKNCC